MFNPLILKPDCELRRQAILQGGYSKRFSISSSRGFGEVLAIDIILLNATSRSVSSQIRYTDNIAEEEP